MLMGSRIWVCFRKDYDFPPSRLLVIALRTEHSPIVMPLLVLKVVVPLFALSFLAQKTWTAISLQSVVVPSITVPAPDCTITWSRLVGQSMVPTPDGQSCLALETWSVGLLCLF